MSSDDEYPMERFERYRAAYLAATGSIRTERVDHDEAVRLSTMVVDALSEELEFWQGVRGRWQRRRSS